jgi:hypothetical protein
MASRLQSNHTTNGLPEPYGHTAQVSPHLPNEDREWYTEYRWKDGQEYEPQDGVITTQPKHAPVPEHVAEERRKERSIKVMNKKPKALNTKKNHTGGPNQASTSSAKWTPKAAATGSKNEAPSNTGSTGSKPIQAKYPDQATKKAAAKKTKDATTKKHGSKSKGMKKKPAKKVWVDDVHSQPKPCGHTSMVHPTNSNRDREWYTEYRWQPGTQYEAQDGPITEQPKPALRGIKASPVTGDPCVEVK